MQPTCVIFDTPIKIWLPQKEGLFRCNQNVTLAAGAKKGTDEVDVSKFPLQLHSFLDCCQFFCIARRKLAGWSNLVTFCRKLPSCGVGSEEVLFSFPTIFTIYIFLVCFIILKIPFCCALSFWQYLVQWSPRCANASDSGEIVECHHRYNMCYKAVISIS